MNTFLKILFRSIIHAMKTGTLIVVVLCLIFANNLNVLTEQSQFVNILVLALMFAVLKFLCGGWSSYSFKWMTWSGILSTAASLFLTYSGFKSGGHDVSFWMMMLPIGIAAVAGIASGIWVNKALEAETDSSIDAESIIGSVFDNGLSDTFSGIMGMYENNVIYSIGRGVAVYSNIVVICGLILFFYYR